MKKNRRILVHSTAERLQTTFKNLIHYLRDEGFEVDEMTEDEFPSHLNYAHIFMGQGYFFCQRDIAAACRAYNGEFTSNEDI